MKTIQRDIYLNKLINRKENGMIKIITGVRRCGKSYLLFNIYYEYLLSIGVKEDQIIKIALDDETNRDYRDPLKLYDYLNKHIVDKNKTYYIFIDEAQYAISDQERKEKDDIKLYGVLNGLLRKENVDIYVTGSNSKFLSTDVLTEFRGRGDEVRIYPLSFIEFMQGYKGDKRDGFKEYSTYGGLPLILNMKTDEEKSNYLINLFENTYKRDVVERNQLKGKGTLDNVVDILASSIGSLTNPNKLARTFISKGTKISDKTIFSYIQLLKDSFLISEAKRYDIKGKHYINSLMKYYFVDIGLRNARLNFRQPEQTHILENIIYNELLIRGYNVDVGVVEHRIKNGDGKLTTSKLEIDFVCNKGSERIYIQSAYAIPNIEKMNQEQQPFTKVKDSFKKVMIVLDNAVAHYNDNGYYIMDVYDFLLNPNSLNF